MTLHWHSSQVSSLVNCVDNTLTETGLIGRGHSDVATWVLPRKLKDAYQTLKYYALVDCNPSGVLIYLIYNIIGSEECAYGMCLAVADIELPGLYLDDVKEADCRPFSDRDLTLVEYLMNGKSYICYTTYVMI